MHTFPPPKKDEARDHLHFFVNGGKNHAPIFQYTF